MICVKKAVKPVARCSVSKLNENGSLKASERESSSELNFVQSSLKDAYILKR